LDLVLPLTVKFGVCGDKMVTRCHLEIRVFFSSWEKYAYQYYLRIFLDGRVFVLV